MVWDTVCEFTSTGYMSFHGTLACPKNRFSELLPGPKNRVQVLVSRVHVLVSKVLTLDLGSRIRALDVLCLLLASIFRILILIQDPRGG